MFSVLALMELYFIRHGETEWSRSGQHTSFTDLALTPRGEEEARTLAPFLQGIAFTHVACSPRRRAQQTCALAGLAAPVIDPDVAEWNYGEYEGVLSATVRATRPDWDIYRDGSPGGESPVEISARADRVIAKVRTHEGRVAIFSHGHFGRVLVARWLGQPLGSGRHFHLDTASVSILRFDEGKAVIQKWNLTPGR